MEASAPQPSRPGLGTALAAAGSATLASLVLLSLARRRRKTAPAEDADDASLPPYPPEPPECHPLLLHALALRPEFPGQHHDLLFLQWHQKLQSSIISFRVPVLGRLVCLSDVHAVKHVLTSRKGFPKSPTYGTLAPLLGRKSLATMEGHEWAAQRRLYNPGFSPTFLEGVVSTIVDKAERFVAEIDAEVERGESTNLLDMAIDLTSDVIAAVAFGEDWGVGDDATNQGMETRDTIRDLTICVGDSMANPLTRMFDVRNMWRTWRLSRKLDGDMRALVLRRLEALRASPDVELNAQKDILSLTLSSVLRSKQDDAKDATGTVSFSNDDMENMTSQLKTFYFAGHDTTATTIAWAYWLLLQNPGCLAKAREEVASSLGEGWAQRATFSAKLPNTTYEKLQKCKYLDAITRETLRLYPPAASTRYASDPDATAGGYRIGSCIVLLNFYSLQRDPAIWGENAEEFVPERFMGDAGRENVASFAFLPFSKGPRDCIGKYFALLKAKIALAALVCRYDGDVVDANEEYTTRLTSIPRNGCKVNLRRRK
ncbi:hypothetical protein ACHAXT_000212 [Thalassiosira profunda]